MMNFRVLEVHTLHVRDFDGGKIVQALGEFRNFEIETACAQSELQAVLYPVKRIFMKILPFLILLIAGMIFSLTLMNEIEIPAIKALGIIAIFCGVSGIITETRKILILRKKFISMSPDEALNEAAWLCVLKKAPKKSGDNDLTYIPVNEETKNLSPQSLAERFNLLPAISKQAFEKIRD